MRGRRLRRVAALMALAAAGTACGGGGDEGGDTGAGGGDEGTPVAGGTLVYGIEAETADGWCLPEAQLAVSGTTVASAIYDTLTRPNAEGVAEPWLAESVEPNADATAWTITLREGVTFHDGSPLDATVVKNNLDAYRGAYPARNPLLFTFVYAPIESVDVVDARTVEVTLDQPWVSFDTALWNYGRTGILAQAQLDDTRTCAENLIGTGPFTLEEWSPNQSFTATKNPDYWATDAAGNQLPYLDAIEFRPIVEVAQRMNALEAGEIDAMHTSDAGTITDVAARAEGGEMNAYQTEDFADVVYLLLNSSVPPFDNVKARRAVAHALDFEEYNAVIGRGILTQANGPFAPGGIGHLDDTGYPTYDPDEAERLVAEYEEETGTQLEFSYTVTNAQANLEQAQLIQQQAEAVGIGVEIVPIDQSTQIDTAISGGFEALQWRNHPGGDPDQQYMWWATGSPVNFGRFSDPDVDRLLEAGRATSEGRDAIYEELNGVFAEQVHNVWINYTTWMVAMAPDTHGVPGEGPNSADAFPGLSAGHQVAYMWVDE